MATRSVLVLDSFRDPFLQLMQEAASNVPGWEGSLVATVDGRKVAVHHTEDMEATRVSAMVGSLVALGDTVCRELKFGRSQSLMLSSGGGHLLALRIPSARETLVLGVLARADATLGLVMHEARRCAGALGECFDRIQQQFAAEGAAHAETA